MLRKNIKIVKSSNPILIHDNAIKTSFMLQNYNTQNAHL